MLPRLHFVPGDNTETQLPTESQINVGMEEAAAVHDTVRAAENIAKGIAVENPPVLGFAF